MEHHHGAAGIMLSRIPGTCRVYPKPLGDRLLHLVRGFGDRPDARLDVSTSVLEQLTDKSPLSHKATREPGVPSEVIQPTAGIVPPSPDGDTRSDEIGLDELYQIAVHTHIFIDTSAWLEPGAATVLGRDLAKCLRRASRKVYVLSRTVDHVLEISKTPSSNLRQAASEGLSLLTQLQGAQLLEDIADPPGFSEPGCATRRIFVLMMLRYQLAHHQTVITQDADTARQLQGNAELEAFQFSKSVNLYYIDGAKLKLWAARLMGMGESEAALCDTTSVSNVAEVAATCKVVADTCSLMLTSTTNDLIGAPYFSNVLLPLMRDAANPLIVPERVIRELETHQRRRDDLAVDAAAAAGREVLDRFETDGLLVRGEDTYELGGLNANFADPVFIQLAIKYGLDHELCFITQDTNLARALIANRQPRGHATHVVYLDRTQRVLKPWEPRLKGMKRKLDRENSMRPLPGRRPERRHSVPATAPLARPAAARPAEPFALPDHPRRTADVKLKISRLPVEGDTVVGMTTGQVRLGRAVAAGGEGAIFETSIPSLVCKIYHAEQLTAGRREKLELMLSRAVNIRGVCWPTDLVLSGQGEFLGYLMPKAEGKILKTAVFAKKLLKRNFPHWTRDNLNQLAITILETIQSLHRLNVFIGDINPQNILVKDERTISLVDLDSAQVEGFPCLVGTETFTPAHRQGQRWDYLRTADDELFAVTTLLFMILFPGNAPYTSQGGGEAAENIVAHKFAYGRDADGRPPVGVWQFIWTHLRRDLQEDFTDVFRLDKRIPIGALIKHLRQEQKDIRDGKRNADIFPDKPRMREGETVEVLCAHCPPDRNMHPVSRTTAEHIREQGRPWYCNACRAMRKMTHLENSREVECTLNLAPDCEGKTSAAITHLDMLESRGQEFQCRPCSAAYREGNKQRWASHRRAQKESKACFVATATYQSEDAVPVMLLRNYRDAILSTGTAGRAFIRCYYVVGPLLAKPVIRFPALRRLSKAVLDRWVRHLARRHPELNPLPRDQCHE
jgi:hypothetical protein